MANDGGLMAAMEQWMANRLAALTFEGKNVFKTAEVWKHQVGPTNAGMEAFERYEPFAFVSYQAADAAREGDYDLRQVLEFAILIGVESKADGVARIGDANHLGTSKLRDLVINLFDRVHPGGTFNCDEFYYTGDVEVLDAPKRHAIQMTFEASQLTLS